MPLDREGKVGHQAEKVMAFVETLRGVTDIEVITQDERFTTAAATRNLRDANVKARNHRDVIDKVAAQQILQLYLDRRAAAGRA